MKSATITLPWPGKVLNPNVRAHWAARARARKKARSWAYFAGLEARLGQMDWSGERIFVRYRFEPPDAQRRDDDNLITSMKACRDGIAQAMGVDDNRFVIMPIEIGDTWPGGRVIVTIEEMPHDT